MRAVGVLLMPPGFDRRAGLGQRGEVMLIQALVAQLTVEALDETVLHRSAGADEVEPDAARRSPLVEGEIVWIGIALIERVPVADAPPADGEDRGSPAQAHRRSTTPATVEAGLGIRLYHFRIVIPED